MMALLVSGMVFELPGFTAVVILLAGIFTGGDGEVNLTLAFENQGSPGESIKTSQWSYPISRGMEGGREPLILTMQYLMVSNSSSAGSTVSAKRP